MPALSRWCVRCALIYLVVGMGVGSWLLIEQANGHAPGTTWPVLHAHLLLVGFLLLLIMGVAHWMFPRVHGTRVGRGGGWVAFALVNAGLILRVLAEPRVNWERGNPGKRSSKSQRCSPQWGSPYSRSRSCRVFGRR